MRIHLFSSTFLHIAAPINPRSCCCPSFPAPAPQPKHVLTVIFQYPVRKCIVYSCLLNIHTFFASAQVTRLASFFANSCYSAYIIIKPTDSNAQRLRCVYEVGLFQMKAVSVTGRMRVVDSTRVRVQAAASGSAATLARLSGYQPRASCGIFIWYCDCYCYYLLSLLLFMIYFWLPIQ